VAYASSERRICDEAANALSAIWPQTYRYHDSPSIAERNRECTSALNRWRKARHLKPLRIPYIHFVRRAATTITQPLLRQFTGGDLLNAERQARSRILSLGLPALTAVRRSRQAAREDRGETDCLFLRINYQLPCVSVRIEFGGVPADQRLVRQLDRIKGRPLNGCSVQRTARTGTDALIESALQECDSSRIATTTAPGLR